VVRDPGCCLPWVPHTGGFWYSTTSSGYCGDDPSSNPPGCSWRVKNVIKRVNKTCSDQSIFSTVVGPATAAPALRADGADGAEPLS